MGKIIWLGLFAALILIIIILLVVNYAVNSGTARLSYLNNNQNITVANNTTVIVTLNSTYWNFTGSSNTQVLKLLNISYNATPQNCTVGGGCGNVTATFNAISPGYADITAHRATCGEALQCNATEGSYLVIVNVT